MLQNYSSQNQVFYKDRDRSPGVSQYYAILKHRIFYLVIPFLLVLVIGSFIVAIQRPIYSSEGKILVESQDIPTDLVKSTVTAGANERIQVIQQRIMTRDN